MFMLAHLVSSLECGLCIAAPLDKLTRTARGGCRLESPLLGMEMAQIGRIGVISLRSTGPSTESVSLLTREKEIRYAPPPDGYRHVPLHRHRGVHPPAPAGRRALPEPPGGVSIPGATCHPEEWRPRGLHARRCLLRGLRLRHRCDLCSSGDATHPRLACLAGGRACVRAHRPAHR